MAYWSIFCIVSEIGGNCKGQVQLNTLISTAARGEKTIKDKFKASNMPIVGENPHQSCGGGREKASFFSGLVIPTLLVVL